MNTKTKQRAVTLITMGCSIFIGTFCGLFLDWLFLPRMIVCGSVAIVSTVTEHYLTVHKEYVEKLLAKFIGEDNDNK